MCLLCVPSWLLGETCVFLWIFFPGLVMSCFEVCLQFIFLLSAVKSCLCNVGQHWVKEMRAARQFDRSRSYLWKIHLYPNALFFWFCWIYCHGSTNFEHKVRFFFCQEGNPAHNLKHNSVVFMLWCERPCAYTTICWEHVCAQWAVRRQQWDYPSWCNRYFLFGCWGRETLVSQHIYCTWLGTVCAKCVSVTSHCLH